MKRKLFFLLCALLTSVGMWADEDKTSLITNPGFEGTYAVKSGTGVSNDRAIYTPNGWEVTYSNPEQNSMTSLNSECLQWSQFSSLTQPTDGGNNVYWIRFRFSGPSIKLSQTLNNLPAGLYTLSAEGYNDNSGIGTATLSIKYGSITSSARFTAKSWERKNVKFFISKAQNVEISYTFLSKGEKCIAGVDNFTLTYHGTGFDGSDTDITDLITDPSFEMNDLSVGWVSNDGGNVASNNNWSAGKVGTYFVERWLKNIALGDGSLTQTIGDLPAGTYKLTANAQNIEQYNSSAHGTGYYLSAGGQKVAVGDAVSNSVYFKLTEAGNVNIGAVLETCTGNWISVDNFQLTYNPTISASFTAITGDMNFTVRTNQANAISAYNDSKTIDNCIAVQNAMYAVAQSKLVYAEIAERITYYAGKASGLDAAGQAAYNVSAIQTKYDNGTYETLAEAEAELSTALQSAAAAQTADGEGHISMTCLITNPTFAETGGWEGSPTINTTYKNAEKFNATFDVYQTVPGLPAGWYKLQAQGFDRQTDVATTFGTETAIKQAVLYAGSAYTLLKGIYDDAGSSRGGNEKSNNDKYMPNDMATAATYFNVPLYENSVLVYHFGGDMQIGIKKLVKNDKDWCMFDNFRLTYMGSNTISDATSMTQYIADPSFESGTKNYWTDNKGSFSAGTGTELSGKVGNYRIGTASNTNRSEDFSQTVKGLPAGKYVMKVTVKNAPYNTNTFSGTVGIGNNSVPMYYNTEKDYTVAYEAASNDASVAVKFAGKFNSAGAFYADNFQLTYYETLPNISVDSELLTEGNLHEYVRTSLANAKSAYEGNKTVANYNALQTAIYNATMSKAEYDALKEGISAGQDVTEFIYNPTFDSNIDGWANTYTGTSGDWWRRTVWVNTGGVESFSTSDADFNQTVKGLPAGIYTITVQAFYRAGGAGNTETTKNASLYANDEHASIMNINDYTALTEKPSTGNWTQINSSYYVPDNTVAANYAINTLKVYVNSVTVNIAESENLEVKIKKTTGIVDDWTYWDNFTLTYVGEALPESVTGVTGLMNATIAANQTAAVNAYNSASPKTVSLYNAALAAIDAAKMSIANYASITTVYDAYIEKAEANMIAVGQAAFKASDKVTKYKSGLYDDDEVSTAKSDIKAEYIAALNTYPVVGADMTDNIANPSFETGDMTGWTNGDMGAQSNVAFDPWKNGTYYAERWHNSGNKSVKQTLSGLPQGKYKLKAAAYATSATSPQVYVKVGEAAAITTAVSAKNDYEVDFDYDGSSTLEIGLSATLANDGWVCVDNFRLTYQGTSVAMQISKDALAATFCAPFDVEIPAGVTAYTAEMGEGAWLSLSEVNEDGKIPAGTPVILKWVGGESTLTRIFYGTIDEETPIDTYPLKGVYESTDVQSDGDNTYYIMQYQNSVTAFFKVPTDAKRTIGANRCYLHIENESGEDPAARIAIGGEETAINEIETINNEAKAMKDGKYYVRGRIVVVKNGKAYSANGQILK